MRISIIGSGNVATHMAAAFKNAGHRIMQVYSPNIMHASLLAYHVGAAATDNITLLNSETDLFIIAVKDDAIASVAKQLAGFDKLIVHTSGALNLTTLSVINAKAGVFYPLQTFSKEKEIDFFKVPICIEGADHNIQNFLIELAKTISGNVQVVNSVKRKVLHLAAVFACNFPNYMYEIAAQILADNQLDFNLLKPLITETAVKVQQQMPATVQTGPATRNDTVTMASHVQMLGDDAFLQSLYQLLSDGIAKMAKTGERPD